MDRHLSEVLRWRRLAVGSMAAAVVALAALVWIWMAWRAGAPEPRELGPEGPELPIEPRPDQLELRAVTFEDLPGWSEDRLEEAWPALRRTCRAWTSRPTDEPLGDGPWGPVAAWMPFCGAVAEVAGDPGDGVVRGLFETWLRPVAISNRGEAAGLFTGYYEPSLRGSRSRYGAYSVPLYLRPPELVNVDLGRFREDLAGRRIAGRLVGDRLEPFYDRGEIDEGALRGRGLEMLWVDDPVDAFFLQIQGSGRVLLDDGGSVRVGYAGQNGHPYTAIGRELVQRGAMPLEDVSMQSIRRWLGENPAEATELMQVNTSYVFFRELDGAGPLGSLGVPLTPERSLAVDSRYLPLGVPTWLDSTVPDPRPDDARGERPYRRLMMAQDTGGAIRGPVRGDLFWGHGDRAAAVAGRMRSEGRLWVLAPRSLEVVP